MTLTPIKGLWIHRLLWKQTVFPKDCVASLGKDKMWQCSSLHPWPPGKAAWSQLRYELVLCPDIDFITRDQEIHLETKGNELKCEKENLQERG